jgi:hypothetical protein
LAAATLSAAPVAPPTLVVNDCGRPLGMSRPRTNPHLRMETKGAIGLAQDLALVRLSATLP